MQIGLSDAPETLNIKEKVKNLKTFLKKIKNHCSRTNSFKIKKKHKYE